MSMNLIENKMRLFLLAILCSFNTFAQSDLLTRLDTEHKTIPYTTTATFKATHVSIGQSVETRKQGVLEIYAQNRFWNRPIEKSQSFAADKINSRLGLDYSLTDRFTIGAGYATGYRSIDVLLKYRLFYQYNKEQKKFPFSITLFHRGVSRGKSTLGFSEGFDFGDGLVSISQVLIARKVTSNFSFQIAPTYIYKEEGNLIPAESANKLAIGFSGRYKVGRHVSIVSEYYYVANPFKTFDTYGPFSLGVNWEIADIILQFNLTNARHFIEDKFISTTINNFNFRDGNLHFGFHATYVFHLKKQQLRSKNK